MQNNYLHQMIYKKQSCNKREVVNRLSINFIKKGPSADKNTRLNSTIPPRLNN